MADNAGVGADPMTTDNSSEWLIRSVDPADAPFILDSWRKAYRRYAFATPAPHRGWHGQSPMRTEVYTRGMTELMQGILRREGVRVLVATAIEDSDQLLGWICFEPGCLHFIYVKQIYWGFGIARGLLDAANISKANPVDYSHRTEFSDRRLAVYLKDFDPFRAFQDRRTADAAHPNL